MNINWWKTLVVDPNFYYGILHRWRYLDFYWNQLPLTFDDVSLANQEHFYYQKDRHAVHCNAMKYFQTVGLVLME